jgi:hypothetical protein
MITTNPLFPGFSRSPNFLKEIGISATQDLRTTQNNSEPLRTFCLGRFFCVHKNEVYNCKEK